MSLDLMIGPFSCTACGRSDDEEQYNYTYNASKMWFEMFPEDKHMVPIDGLTGSQALKKIDEAIRLMNDHADSLRELEPKNGWGSYQGFLEYLKALRDACLRYPESVWRSWR